ncbi:hypothetical protein DFJ73DRAFT_824385 [Zopfochytrium polystomum]|nr:hypothetical protein DFJ73DRAFT_824385 [Zopfochytrium polystomum]
MRIRRSGAWIRLAGLGRTATMSLSSWGERPWRSRWVLRLQEWERGIARSPRTATRGAAALLGWRRKICRRSGGRTAMTARRSRSPCPHPSSTFACDCLRCCYCPPSWRMNEGGTGREMGVPVLLLFWGFQRTHHFHPPAPPPALRATICTRNHTNQLKCAVRPLRPLSLR